MLRKDTYIMKKKLIAAILTGAMLAAGMSATVWADGEKSFVYGTTGYSEEMGDAGLNPHDNYSGWSTLRYGVGETLFKYNDNMEVEPWLATDYEFVDDTTVKITLRDGVKFSSGRTMDAEAVKECLEDLIAVHDRAPYDLKIDHMEAVVQQGGICFVLLHFAKLSETYLLPAPALIHYYNIDHGSKSMPLSYIQEHGFLVDKNRLPSVPYLDIIEQKLLGGI